MVKKGQQSVHKLVAMAFQDICGTYFEGAEPDHINTIRDDNRAENLHLVTRSENCLNPITRKRKSLKWKGNTYAIGKLINRKDQSKPVLQFTKDGVFIAEYQSVSEAYRQTGIAVQHISSCCLGKLKSAGGFDWKYKGDGHLPSPHLRTSKLVV